MNCNECRWFESLQVKTDRFDSKTGTRQLTLLGICRKYPPSRFVDPDAADTTSGWPTTSGRDWCGEWKDVVDDSSRTTGPALPGRRWTDWKDDQEWLQRVAMKANKPQIHPLGTGDAFKINSV